MKSAKEYTEEAVTLWSGYIREGGNLAESLAAIEAMFRKYGADVAVAQRSADAFSAAHEAVKSTDVSTAAVIQRAVWDTPIVRTP